MNGNEMYNTVGRPPSEIQIQIGDFMISGDSLKYLQISLSVIGIFKCFKGQNLLGKSEIRTPAPFQTPFFIVKSAILKFIYLSPTTVGNTPSENQRPKLYRMNAKLKIKT